MSHPMSLTKRLLISISLLALSAMLPVSFAQDKYPQKSINGIIMWGEGGATDIIARTLAPLVEKELDGSFVMQNRTGAAGAVAMQYVHTRPADGYTVLFGAENPNLHQVLDLSDLSYQNDYTPITITANSYAGIFVRKDSPFTTLDELIDHVKANPNKLIFATTGAGGLPNVVLAILHSELGTEFKTVPYDGEGPATVALLGGHVDATSVTVSAGKEYLESGDFRMLAIVNDKPLAAYPNAPAITDIYPDIAKYLPWGPFQGVFVHRDTPEAIVTTLREAFQKVVATDQFRETLANLGMEYLNISGDEAMDFLDRNRSTSTWMLFEAGDTEYSPEEFGIPKIEE